MPSKYISKREIVLNFLSGIVIPNIKERKDVDYQKLIDFIVSEKCVSFKLAQEYVDLFVRQGIIKREGNVLTIPDKEVENWLISEKAKDNEIKKGIEVLENAKQEL